MIGMGFLMGKGVYSDVLSDLFSSATPGDLFHLRDRLRDVDQDFGRWELFELASQQPSLTDWLGKYGLDEDQFVAYANAHIVKDWMASHVKKGIGNDPNEYQTPRWIANHPDEAADFDEKLTTGSWIGWRGDAEGIIAEGLARTIEVSLRVGKGQGAGDITGDRLPVDFRWICTGSRLEWWLTWDDSTPYRPEGGGQSDGSGRVTATFASPGLANDALIDDWYQAFTGHIPPPVKDRHLTYADPPVPGQPAIGMPDTTRNRGMLGIGRPCNTNLVYVAQGFEPPGFIPIPPQLLDDGLPGAWLGSLSVSCGEIALATVAPAAEELGVIW